MTRILLCEDTAEMLVVIMLFDMAFLDAPF